MSNEPRPRNPYSVASRLRNGAGTHTSTDKKREKRRGGSRNVVQDYLCDYEDEIEFLNTEEEKD